MIGRLTVLSSLWSAYCFAGPVVVSTRPDQGDIVIDAGISIGLRAGDKVCVREGKVCGKVSTVLPALAYVAMENVSSVAIGMPTCKPDDQSSSLLPSTPWRIPKIRLPTADLSFFPLYTVAALVSPQTTATYNKLTFINGRLASEGAVSQALLGVKLSLAFPLGSRQLVRLSAKAKAYKPDAFANEVDPVVSATIEGQVFGGSVEWAPLNARIGPGWVSASIGADAQDSRLTIKAVQGGAANVITSQVLVGSVAGSLDYFLPIDTDSFLSFGGTVLIPVVSSTKFSPPDQVVIDQALGHARSSVALELSIGYSFK